MVSHQPRRRGRPPKFGKPSRLVAMTLPEDVLSGLRDVHPDPAWAVVRLFDGERKQRGASDTDGVKLPAIVEVSKAQSLIMVDPRVVKNLPRVSTIPIDEKRAFLAMEDGRGLADLELAVLDRIDQPDVSAAEAAMLRGFREQLRQWRTDASLQFDARTIIVVGRRAPARARKTMRRTLGAVSASYLTSHWIWNLLPELTTLM